MNIVLDDGEDAWLRMNVSLHTCLRHICVPGVLTSLSRFTAVSVAQLRFFLVAPWKLLNGRRFDGAGSDHRGARDVRKVRIHKLIFLTVTENLVTHLVTEISWNLFIKQLA